jgi:hypothetical protein
MSIRLPRPIALYIAAENAGETSSVDECFTAAAVVRDEGRDGSPLLKARLEGDRITVLEGGA